MLTLAHWIILALYVVVLPAAVVWAVVKVRQVRHIGPAGSLIVTCLVGIVLGSAISVVYAVAVQGKVLFTQIALASYFAASMLLLIKVFDFLLRRGLVRLFRVGPAPEAAGGRSRFVRSQLAGSVRVVLLFVLALPYVMAAVMTYRPKVALADTPKTQLGFDFETVSFRATDGTDIRAWWIPAMPQPSGADRANPDWGRRTVLVCHGLGANRSNQLILSRALVPAGYNVLALDFRAHGESGGQLTTFGDLERRDVLGAVRWLKGNRAEEARRIFGVGASMGAAALVAAAGDPSPEGRAIDALALYACYDSVENLARSVADERFAFPMDWLMLNVSLPMASVQTGRDLDAFAPARLVRDIWPRPILFIHGEADEIIPFERGQALYEAADQPKWHVWLQSSITRGDDAHGPRERWDHNNIVNSDLVSHIVRLFFDNAESVPVI